jgi:hypothetical protein
MELNLQLQVGGIVMATIGIILTGTGLILDNYQKYKDNDSARRFERALKNFCQNSSGNHTLSKECLLQEIRELAEREDAEVYETR